MVNDLASILQEDKDNWWSDRMYLQDAAMAARHSFDPNTQVGATLVVPNGMGVVLTGCNGIPDRLRKAGYPVVAEQKNYCTEHAERNVIFAALENRITTNGLTMYCTWASCSECARSMIRFGISRVVTLTGLVERTPDRWCESVRHGLMMLRDSGVRTVGWRGDLGITHRIMFNKTKIWNKDLF